MPAASPDPAPSDATFVVSPSRPTIAMTRVLDAPRGLVFEAMTRPEHLARWWGPRTHEMVTCEVDLRRGGAYRFVLRDPKGRLHPFSGEFREISPPERLVMIQRYEPVRGEESTVRITLVDLGTRTRVEMEQELSSIAARDAMVAAGAKQGAIDSYDRLAELIGELAHYGRELVIARKLAAPRALVYAAFTDAAHLARWWGPRGFSLETHELDVRAGGRFRHTMRGPDGHAFPFQGVYTEVVPLERLAFESVIHDGVEVKTVVTFEDHAGGTTVTVRQTHSKETAATRGAKEGWSQSLDRLAAVVSSAGDR
jgi:uncharacterized protein YndB with AHSA1/START domain